VLQKMKGLSVTPSCLPLAGSPGKSFSRDSTGARTSPPPKYYYFYYRNINKEHIIQYVIPPPHPTPDYFSTTHSHAAKNITGSSLLPPGHTLASRSLQPQRRDSGQDGDACWEGEELGRRGGRGGL
jgi:hypothetical protein